MSMKQLREAYQRQYGKPAPKFTDITTDWEVFQVHYNVIGTKDLLYLKKSCHVYMSMIDNDLGKEHGNLHVLKVIDALKRELDTREHIPNKAERRAIRQQKAKNAKSSK